MLVNGVDISMLEGWMIKINSNPTFFGKNMNRRWFKVGFVPGPGSEKKLVISYSTNKTAKDPRGWLYVEDVSGIYCRREMIEIVSPSRTLRLKGETAVEHRLWSDSLYKLCNPPPKSATAVVNTTPAPAEPRRERTPRRETKHVDGEDEDRAPRRRRSDRERERDLDRDRDRDRDREREREHERHERERERRPALEEERERGSRSARSNRREDSDREDRDSDNRRRGRNRDRNREHSPRDDYDDRDTRKRHSPSPKQRESWREERESSSSRSSRRSPRSSRHDQGEEIASSRDQQPSPSRPSEFDGSDDDSSEDGRDSSRPSTNSSTRSLLVAQIKSGSFETDIAQCKNVMSDSEEEDDANYHYEKKEDPEESPREPLTSSTDPIDDEPFHEELEQMNPERMIVAQPSKRKNSEYFASDEEEHELKVSPPVKHSPVHNDRKAPVSSVTAGNNFVHDDWDAEEVGPSSPAPRGKTSYPSGAVSGGVAADANFVHDDWDD